MDCQTFLVSNLAELAAERKDPIDLVDVSQKKTLGKLSDASPPSFDISEFRMRREREGHRVSPSAVGLDWMHQQSHARNGRGLDRVPRKIRERPGKFLHSGGGILRR
jgi:hypothetical protein